MNKHILKVAEDSVAQRLDVFLAQSLACSPSRSFVRKLIDFGHVKVNEYIVKAHHKVVFGDEIFVEIPKGFLTQKYISPEQIDLDIFYEDECLLVINKPSGMLVHPARGCYSGTLVNALLNYSGKLSDGSEEMRPGIVHRLDKETSGLILIAKDNITHAKLAKQFQRRLIQKKYIALVGGIIEFDEGMVDAPLGRHPRHFGKRGVKFDDSAKEAITYYKVIKRSDDVTLVSLFPKTGRTHQLRVHMSYMKHPILGDEKYGNKKTFFRLALHAQSIGFQHPYRKCLVEFSTHIPKKFLLKVPQE